MADDVITLLHRQHENIRTLFAEVEAASGDERTDAWHRLVRLLSVHETAEEEIVHPAIARVNGGEPIVDARIAEERRAKELLSTMNDMGPDAEGFDTLLVQLRDDVLAHADHEEQAEFPLLRKVHDQERLERMAKAVEAAEAIAPTRPHPGVEGPVANLALGPIVAVVDRARDAIRKILG
ncbi:hemerythrin domain-containing protein [Lentzea nigeriaca]|uniref:hemerythrin domain-containing protein n=1 Tax=Lentzea nigeriaca TaxID=1128665 RepID=UPI00195C43A9|nr:hemerythrin domain-containing protein [Lentzea nigeriaca]MBM7864702.1 hemerythrin superfamily protein [Lentzea nigeriaca]